VSSDGSLLITLPNDVGGRNPIRRPPVLTMSNDVILIVGGRGADRRPLLRRQELRPGTVGPSRQEEEEKEGTLAQNGSKVGFILDSVS
jgi:hypothetical protein